MRRSPLRSGVHGSGLTKRCRSQSSCMRSASSLASPEIASIGRRKGSKFATAILLKSPYKKGVRRRPLFMPVSKTVRRSGFGRTGAVRQFFLDTRRLARTFTQIVQFGATDIAATLDLDQGDQW